MTRVLIALLVVWGAAWVVGAGKREMSRPMYRRASSVVGLAAMFATVGALWKWRRHVVTGAAVTVVATFTAGVVVAWWWAPQQRPLIVFTAAVAATFGAAAWDWDTTKGRPWRDVIAERRRADQVRAAVVAANPDARPGRVIIDGAKATVEVEHVGSVDAERVGQALHAPHADHTPGAEMGRTTIRVHDQPPAGEWERLAIPRRWPGPSSAVRDAPIPIGLDAAGNLVCVPFPGSGGRHVLIGGATGAGKSVLLSVILAELVSRRDVALMLGDPKHVEFGAWRDVADVAVGAAATGDMLDTVYREMMARYELLEVAGARQWDGQKVVLVVDELSAVTTTGDRRVVAQRIERLGLILAMGRAAGVGVVLCTQRPSKDVIPLDLRDNCRVRIALGTGSEFGTGMVLGDRSKWPAHEIPPSLPGVCYVLTDRTAVLARSFLLDDSGVANVVASARERVA